MARVRRPWGRRGEVIAELLTDFPERLAGREVWVGERKMRLDHIRPHQSAAVLKFAGIDSIDDAGTLAGSEVQIPAADRPRLDEGAVYWDQLEGCRVIEAGEEIGTVRHLDPTVGTPVLVVDTPGGELLIPFAQEICVRVDPASRMIEVRLPPGLRELNRRELNRQ